MLVHQSPVTSVRSNSANSERGDTLLPITAEKLHRLIGGIFRGRVPCGELERMGGRCGSRVLRGGLHSPGRGIEFYRLLLRLGQLQDRLLVGIVLCERSGGGR